MMKICTFKKVDTIAGATRIMEIKESVNGYKKEITASSVSFARGNTRYIITLTQGEYTFEKYDCNLDEFLSFDYAEIEKFFDFKKPEIIALLEEIVSQDGNNDLWEETNEAAVLLLEGGYEGHGEDLEALEDVTTGFELEERISQGEWHFQNPTYITIVTSSDGTKYEIRYTDDGDANIEWRLLGDEEWLDAIWTFFCDRYNIDFDALS